MLDFSVLVDLQPAYTTVALENPCWADRLCKSTKTRKVSIFMIEEITKSAVDFFCFLTNCSKQLYQSCLWSWRFYNWQRPQPRVEILSSGGKMRSSIMPFQIIDDLIFVNPKCHILIILPWKYWHFRKSKVDTILILDHRRTILARFWTPQTRLRQPNTTPESKMDNFEISLFSILNSSIRDICSFQQKVS